MKKILSLLGAICIIASGTSSIISCNTNNPTPDHTDQIKKNSQDFAQVMFAAFLVGDTKAGNFKSTVGSCFSSKFIISNDEMDSEQAITLVKLDYTEVQKQYEQMLTKIVKDLGINLNKNKEYDFTTVKIVLSKGKENSWTLTHKDKLMECSFNIDLNLTFNNKISNLKVDAKILIPNVEKNR